MEIHKNWDYLSCKEAVESLGLKLLDDKYVNIKTKMNLSDKDGYKYFLTLDTLLCKKNAEKVGSRKFSKSNPYTYDNIRLWIAKNNKNFVFVGGIYENNSKKTLIFHCNQCGEDWNTSWTITNIGCGCPYCSGMRVGSQNNLEFLYPQIAAEWDYENNTDVPRDYNAKCHLKKNWICSVCGYRWSATIANRTCGHTGCPACASKTITEFNNLAAKFPEHALEWNYEKNFPLKPTEVFGSSGKKYWWKCSKCGYEWCMSPNSRIGKQTGCPKCDESKGEKAVGEYLNNKSIAYIKEYSFSGCRNIRVLPFDFYLSGLNVCVEYQGIQHYEPVDFAGRGKGWAEEFFEQTQKKDQIRRDYCLANNIKLIEIPYWDFDNIESILTRELFLDKIQLSYSINNYSIIEY